MRTGCITCKKRHVKCDEAKPHCGNCLQTRGHCEGYLISPRKNAKPGQLYWNSKQIVRHAGPPRAQVRLDTSATDFRDDASMLYFREFVGLVQGPWMSAVSSGDLWGVTLPQLARNNGTLRSAAMAVGALSVWHRQSTQRSLRTVSVPDQQVVARDAHYFQAVAHYCESLKLQRQRASLQDAVFLSVLLLLFETLRGNRKAGLDHVNHALSLLLALMTDADAHLYLAGLAPNPKPVLGAVADVFHQLAKQARTVVQGTVADGPPLPNLTKGLRDRKHTMESFMVLLSEVSRSSAARNPIPPVFSSLEEFEQVWPTVKREQAAMGSVIEDAILTLGAHGRHGEHAINKFHEDLFNNPRIREYSGSLHRSMEQLDAAFRPLFDRIIMADVESPAYLRAVVLRLECLGVYAFNDPRSFGSAESLAALTPLLREYLSVGQIALSVARRGARKNPAYHLSLQCGLAWHLMIIALYCRDATVRNEAMWMLEDYPGQDGLWNARALHAVALRNRHIERVNTAEGTADEQWRRLWRREFVFENGGDGIVLRYMEKDGSTGAWHLVEEVATVRGEDDDVQWTRQPVTGHDGLILLDLYSASNGFELDSTELHSGSAGA